MYDANDELLERLGVRGRAPGGRRGAAEWLGASQKRPGGVSSGPREF
jgi:hypothetical protein